MARVFPRWHAFDELRTALDPEHMFSIFADELAPEDSHASWDSRNDPAPWRDVRSAAVVRSGS